MDANELFSRLIRQPIVQSCLPLQFQLGLPWLEKKNGQLVLSFRPHREAAENGKILMYAPMYELAWVYPFEKVVLFRDLTLEAKIDADQPVCVVSEQKMLDSGIYCYKELSEGCSRVLSFQEEEGMVSNVSIQKYQQLYAKVVRELNLEALYGSVDEDGN